MAEDNSNADASSWALNLILLSSPDATVLLIPYHSMARLLKESNAWSSLTSECSIPKETWLDSVRILVICRVSNDARSIE